MVDCIEVSLGYSKGDICRTSPRKSPRRNYNGTRAEYYEVSKRCAYKSKIKSNVKQVPYCPSAEGVVTTVRPGTVSGKTCFFTRLHSYSKASHHLNQEECLSPF